ncbi:hypothetical protein V8C86DRAFT_2748934 [Haematococcus lacustris]
MPPASPASAAQLRGRRSPAQPTLCGDTRVTPAATCSPLPSHLTLARGPGPPKQQSRHRWLWRHCPGLGPPPTLQPSMQRRWQHPSNGCQQANLRPAGFEPPTSCQPAGQWLRCRGGPGPPQPPCVQIRHGGEVAAANLAWIHAEGGVHGVELDATLGGSGRGGPGGRVDGSRQHFASLSTRSTRTTTRRFHSMSTPGAYSARRGWLLFSHAAGPSLPALSGSRPRPEQKLLP